MFFLFHYEKKKRLKGEASTVKPVGKVYSGHLPVSVWCLPTFPFVKSFLYVDVSFFDSEYETLNQVCVWVMVVTAHVPGEKGMFSVVLLV